MCVRQLTLHYSQCKMVKLFIKYRWYRRKRQHKNDEEKKKTFWGKSCLENLSRNRKSWSLRCIHLFAFSFSSLAWRCFTATLRTLFLLITIGPAVQSANWRTIFYKSDLWKTHPLNERIKSDMKQNPWCMWLRWESSAMEIYKNKITSIPQQLMLYCQCWLRLQNEIYRWDICIRHCAQCMIIE